MFTNVVKRFTLNGAFMKNFVSKNGSKSIYIYRERERERERIFRQALCHILDF